MACAGVKLARCRISTGGGAGVKRAYLFGDGWKHVELPGISLKIIAIHRACEKYQ